MTVGRCGLKGVRTEIKSHTEVCQACCGQDDYRNLVEETDASRPLRVAEKDNSQICASRQEKADIRDDGVKDAPLGREQLWRREKVACRQSQPRTSCIRAW